MQPQPLSNIYPFLSTLREWQAGIQVDCGPDWDMTTCDAAVERGPHPSAQTAEAIELFAEDISYQEKAGFCQVFLWDELRSLHPKNLKISPVAVVPQEGRHGWIILDLSFPVYQEVDGVMTIIQSSVNDTTEIKAPTIPVKEIGKVLHRLLHFMKMTRAPGARAGKWILFSKLDISGGSWRSRNRGPCQAQDWSVGRKGRCLLLGNFLAWRMTRRNIGSMVVRAPGHVPSLSYNCLDM